MRNQTIVCLSTTDWDAPQFGSRQQVMMRLAGNNRVLFVELPRALHSLVTDPTGTRRQVGRWLRGGLRQIQPGLMAYAPPPVLPIYYHPATNAVNQRITTGSVRAACRRLGWQPTVLWTYWPNSRHIVGRLGERLSVYHCIDDFARVPYPFVTSATIARQEEALARAVDIVFVRTQGQLDRLRRFNSNAHLVRGGVDFDAFASSDLEPDPQVSSIAPPRVGWVGTLDDRVDADLVLRCAQQTPEISWVIVGPIKRHRLDLDSVVDLPNVHHLPPCDYRRVPSIVTALDVCLIPYRLTSLTEGVSPLKLYECLAAGKPVVATPLPYLTDEVDVVYLARTSREFVRRIREALHDPARAQEVAHRQQRARAHSWDAHVSQITAVLDGFLSSRSQSQRGRACQ